MNGIQIGSIHIRWVDQHLWLSTPDGQYLLTAQQAATLRTYLQMITDLDDPTEEQEKDDTPPDSEERS